MKKALIAITIGFISCKEPKILTCTVEGHNTSSDKVGYIGYNTILSCSDGSLRNIEGMRYFIKPIGYKSQVKVIWSVNGEYCE